MNHASQRRTVRLFNTLHLVCFGLTICTMSVGCTSSGKEAALNDSAVFSSPGESIPEIRRLMRAEDWPALAGYYDLTDSDLDRGELESGNFFIVRDTRALGQPVEVTRYRHPFPPVFDFERLIATADPDIVVVEMTLAIDQGDGMPLQRSLAWFKMKRTAGGWKILPDVVAEEETRDRR